MTLLKITDDLYDIAARLKSVKSSYETYYNPVKRRFEVHDMSQAGNTLAFVVPYDRLDARTVDFAIKTSVANADALIAEIDKSNAAAEKNATDKYVDKTMELYEQRRFYERNGNN